MLRNRKAQTATEFAVLGALVILAFSFLINYSEKLNRQQSYIMQTFRAALKEARNANNAASYTRVAFRRMPNVDNPMELGQLQSFSNTSNVLWADGKDFRKEDGEDASGVMQYRDVPGVVKYHLNEDTAIDIPQPETFHNLILDLQKAGIGSSIISDLEDIQTALGESQPDYQGQAEKLSAVISQLEAAGVDPAMVAGLNDILASLSGGQTETSTNTFTNIVDATTTFEKQETPGGIVTTKTLDAGDTLQAEVTIGGEKHSFTHYLGADGKYYPDKTTLQRSRSMQ